MLIVHLDSWRENVTPAAFTSLLVILEKAAKDAGPDGWEMSKHVKPTDSRI